MDSSAEDWGRTISLLSALYHIRPWEVERLTDAQIEMLMENSGYIRHIRDLPMLQYQFSKLDDKAVSELVEDFEAQERDKAAAESAGRQYKAPVKNSVRARGWQIFALFPYGLLEDAETQTAYLSMSAACAEGIARLVEQRKCPDRAWRGQIGPHWDAITALAATYRPSA